MSLNGSALGAAIASALGVTDAVALDSYDKLGNAIVDYFVANTVVSTNDTIPALGLVSIPGTAGGPVQGEAQGTGVGSIS